MKNWEKKAFELLEKSLTGIPSELNELDWKENLSPNYEKLSHHLSAFANNPGGGFLIFGVDNKLKQATGISSHDSDRIISTLSSRARGTLNPEIIIEHHHLSYEVMALP